MSVSQYTQGFLSESMEPCSSHQHHSSYASWWGNNKNPMSMGFHNHFQIEIQKISSSIYIVSHHLGVPEATLLIKFFAVNVSRIFLKTENYIGRNKY